MHSASERSHWSFEQDGEIVTQAIQPYIETDNYLVLKELAAGTLVEVLGDYKCTYADGALPAMWMVFADRRVLRHTRLLADFIVEELSRR